MKILMINSVCGIRSTGRICTDLADVLTAQGHECKIAYGRETVPEKYKKYAVRIGNDLDVNMHALKSRAFDNAGFGSRRVTERFIKWVIQFDPDIIHLHNIHGYYINIEVLFDYLRTCGKKIIWTLHDCWSFTGHCSYFDFAQCSKWITKCGKCIQKKEYPESIWIDRSAKNYIRKQQLFTNIDNLVIVTPSQWLASLVKKSFLTEYPIRIIHNGIDTTVFNPNIITHSSSSYNLDSRKIILGVAAIWNRRKGLDDLIKVSELLNNEYQTVIIGLSKEQVKSIPSNIRCIARTNNAQELAELYRASSVFVNPTYEDNYPTTNLEAIACGTPVVTYNTGGSGESANFFGIAVEKGNITQLCTAIRTITNSHNHSKMPKELLKNISITQMVDEYIKLYTTTEILGNSGDITSF